jgi:hypothetical protein
MLTESINRETLAVLGLHVLKRRIMAAGDFNGLIRLFAIDVLIHTE